MSVSTNRLNNLTGLVYRRLQNPASVLFIPLIVFELLVFLIPFLILVRISLYESTVSEAYVDGTVTLANYVTILTSGFYHDLIASTLIYAVAAAIPTLIISIFFAYAIWRADPPVRQLLLIGAILPLLTTLVIRLYALLVVMSPVGILNDLLMSTGIVNEPVLFINNLFGAVVGQVYINTPYAILTIYGVLSTLDWELIEASEDLGASRIRSFYEVVLPHITPGILIGAVISLAWGVGAYTSPRLLGSGSERTIAIEVEYLMLQQFDWPIAAGLAVVALVIILLNIGLLFAYLSRIGGMGGE